MDTSLTTVAGIKGWVLTHPRYGKWFISRDAVIADWKQDHAQAYPDEPNAEPSEADVRLWFCEQTTWIEVAQHGKQLERPDMDAIEKAWLKAMSKDADYVALT